MVKVNLGGCDSFVKDADYKVYVGKALEALEVLESGTGEGNDFIGWKHLPSETPEALILVPVAPSRPSHIILRSNCLKTGP